MATGPESSRYVEKPSNADAAMSPLLPTTRVTSQAIG